MPPTPERTAAPPPLPRNALWRAWRAPLVALLLLAGAATLFALNPTSTRLYPPCPFRWATGLHCPGCGSTRALHHLLHGRVATAFGLNPLLVVSLPFLGYALVRGATHTRTRRPRRPLPAWAIWVLFAVVLAFGVLRNLPWKPTRWMAP